MFEAALMQTGAAEKVHGSGRMEMLSIYTLERSSLWNFYNKILIDGEWIKVIRLHAALIFYSFKNDRAECCRDGGLMPTECLVCVQETVNLIKDINLSRYLKLHSQSERKQVFSPN